MYQNLNSSYCVNHMKVEKCNPKPNRVYIYQTQPNRTNNMHIYLHVKPSEKRGPHFKQLVLHHLNHHSLQRKTMREAA